MRRAVILATLLLLAVAGITLARESTIDPARGTLTESTVQEDTTATGEPSATTVREFTDTTDKGSAQRSEPTASNVTQYSTEPEADEPEIHEEDATEGKGEKIDKPEGNGKATGNEGEINGDGGQQKVTICHKGKKTLTVGAPAEAAHLRHGDTKGPCVGQ